MKKCKYCGSVHKEYRDQKDSNGRIFHVVECIRGCHRVVSFQSITNARKLWKEQNIVTKQDMYDAIVQILECYFDNETLEKVRNTILEYESKINEVQ